MIHNTFSDSVFCKSALQSIQKCAAHLPQIAIMEVCGTHTMEIARLGLRSLLPETISLISGPGCPVCVTPVSVIDASIKLAREKQVAVCTFGDMLRVPGTTLSLESAHAMGCDVSIVVSPAQAVAFAKENPSKEYVFIAVGFETTIPAVGSALMQAHQENLKNISFLVCHRIIPPALNILIQDPQVSIHGFLLPGHVSAIIGEEPYQFLTTHGIASAITGFEPLDILLGIQSVLTQMVEKHYVIDNRYKRVVKASGNPLARKLIEELFEITDASWRGIGILPLSGLVLREKYTHLDACVRHEITIIHDMQPTGCSCGSVMRGILKPNQCALFSTKCTPQSPVGPCMVSSEGSCAAYYKYG